MKDKKIVDIPTAKFLAEKMLKSVEGNMTSTNTMLMTCMVIMAWAFTKSGDKDLDNARQAMDKFKSQMLDILSSQGWE